MASSIPPLPPMSSDQPSIIHPSPSRLAVGEIGGKAFNLFKIKEFSVPPFFVVPTTLFKQFLETQAIFPLLDELNILCKNPQENEYRIKNSSEKIKEAVLKREFPDSIRSEILHSYKALLKETGSAARFAARSSGVIEDSAASSCAGLYDSVLNFQGEIALLSAVKEVWASSFNLRIIYERIKLALGQLECMMGVVVQELIEAAASGVVSTVVLGNHYPGIQISANYGMGVSVVDGEITPDAWVLHKDQGYILEQFLGSKQNKISLNGESGLQTIPVEGADRAKFCLSVEEVSEIGKIVQEIKRRYDSEIDVEFALGPQRKIYILQARPLALLKNETEVVDLEGHSDTHPIARGRFSVPGVSTGKLVFVPSWDALAEGKVKVLPGEIAIAFVTTNTWSQHLANIRGLITCEGSPSSHPILLCREKGVPCVIGLSEDDFRTVLSRQGQIVSLDGHNQVIYSGSVATKKANVSDLLQRFKTLEIRQWPTIEQSLPSLIHNKMVIFHEGRYWRKTPTFPIVGFQAEINLRRFEQIGQLLNLPNVQVEAKVIDGYVCALLVPFDQHVALFESMSIQSAHIFHKNQRKCMRQFLQISQNFELRQDVWEKYVELAAKFRAYIWLGGGLRAFAERMVDELGIRMGLPNYYLEECAHLLQSQIPELDTDMHKEIHQLALEFENLNLPPDVAQLEKENPIAYKKVEKIALDYRFEHQISLHLPADLNIAFRRILSEIDHIKAGHVFSTNKTEQKDRTILPNTELSQWLQISIENRLLQSDSHHLDARSKALVRPKLLALGENVFNLSISEVSKAISHE